MATRIIYSLLVDGKQISCCSDRKADLERRFTSTVMGYILRTVTMEDLATCHECGINKCLNGRDDATNNG